MRRRSLPLLIMAGLVLPGCQWLPAEPEPPALQLSAPVSTQRAVVTVTRGNIQSRLPVNVTFGTEEQRSLYARRGGRVREMYVRHGERVQAGRVLVELESGQIGYDMELAAIDLERAKAALARAESRRGFVDAPSAADIDRLTYDIRAAEIRYRRTAEQLADLRIIAPFDGTVVGMTLTVGDQAEAYKEIVVVAADGPLVARANADEATAARLRPGQSVLIYPNDAQPIPVKGTVKSVPALGAGSGRTLTVIIQPEESPRLRQGANARAEIVLAEKQNVLLVPLSAVREFGGSRFVTVVQGDSRQEITVTLGLEDGQMAEVVSGLAEGDQVIAR